MYKTLTAAAILAALIATSSPAGALNVTRSGGGCHRINTTNDLGWPVEYCRR